MRAQQLHQALEINGHFGSVGRQRGQVDGQQVVGKKIRHVAVVRVQLGGQQIQII